MTGYRSQLTGYSQPSSSSSRDMSGSPDMRRDLAVPSAVVAILLTSLLFLAGCTVGPRYVRPPVPPPPSSFKEVPPNWKTAQPNDQVIRGNWWEIYNDSQLNSLEEKINVSNQNLKIAQAQYDQARALVHFNRADYYPTVTAGASATRIHESAKRPFSTLSANTANDFVLPVDASYEPDVWGRVRRTVEASREQAQASAADLATVSLSLHGELALDYLQLRELDAEERLLNDSVAAYEKALELTQNRFHGGIVSQVDVAQAQTQLETTRAQAIDVQVQRAQFEHAIAVLVGESASTFSLPSMPLAGPPPVVPPGMPSQLLERRPDIAAAERRAAAANANIGVAKAAYFPLLSITGSGGFESAMAGTWFTGPAGFISAGVGALETVFDGGRRRAVSDQAWAAYAQSVASYRETVLGAFQDVEDNLAAMRILEDEAKTQDVAVRAAENSLNLSLNRYRGGVATYLEVTTAQGIALSDERTAVQILGRRLTSSVLLIKALGGGWDVAQLPKS